MVIDKSSHRESGEIMKLSLLGQVLTKNHFNKKAFMDMMISTLVTAYPVQFRELSEKMKVQNVAP